MRQNVSQKGVPAKAMRQVSQNPRDSSSFETQQAIYSLSLPQNKFCASNPLNLVPQMCLKLATASNPHFLCLKIICASNDARLTRVNPAPFFDKSAKKALLPQKQKVHRERYGAPQVVAP